MGTSDIQSVSSWQRRVMEQRRVKDTGRAQLCSSVNPLKPPTFYVFIPIFRSSGKPSPPTSLIRFPWRVSDGAAPPPPLLTNAFVVSLLFWPLCFWSFSSLLIMPVYHLITSVWKKLGEKPHWGGLANIQGHLAKCTPWLITCFTRRVMCCNICCVSR